MSQYISKTLPVNLIDGVSLDCYVARSIGEDLSGKYCFNEPYPHIVIDDFLPREMAEKILDRFPCGRGIDDILYTNGYFGHNKRQIMPESCDGFCKSVFNFFNSRPILEFLEGLTAIDSLIGDPYFLGGGFHEISTGGKLGIHADFRINEKIHLERRLNLLIYLNKDWPDEFGGCFEIWNKDMSKKKCSIKPIFNRCVIFSTGETSFHGHPDPLSTPSNVTRKSMALYYYTASKNIYSEIPAYSTMYHCRPAEEGAIRKEVLKARRYQYMRDWFPPIILRKFEKYRTLIKTLKIFGQ